MSSPVVLFTGALTGTGRATALAFANEGARVVVSGRHDDEGQKLAAELRKQRKKANLLQARVPNKRIGTAEEIANAIVFIASLESVLHHRCIPGG